MAETSEEDGREAAKDLNSLEVRVLTELACGATDTEVALKLLIYEDVVRKFYRSAIKKIGVRDHAQAMAWARQHLTVGSGAA